PQQAEKEDQGNSYAANPKPNGPIRGGHRCLSIWGRSGTTPAEPGRTTPRSLCVNGIHSTGTKLATSRVRSIRSLLRANTLERLPYLVTLHSAPAVFQRVLNSILTPLLGKTCQVYIDDVIIGGKDREALANNVQEVL